MKNFFKRKKNGKNEVSEKSEKSEKTEKSQHMSTSQAEKGENRDNTDNDEIKKNVEEEEEEEENELSLSVSKHSRSESNRFGNTTERNDFTREQDPSESSRSEEESIDADMVLGVDLGEGAIENDENCPLSFSIVQQRIDDFNFHMQKQKNEIFAINKNINDIKALLDDLYKENETLQSIVDEFQQEAINNNSSFIDSKRLIVSPETDQYCQHVERVFSEFVKTQTMLSTDAANVSSLVENLELLKKMNTVLKERIAKNADDEADVIIDLLEDDVARMEEENQEIRDKYVPLIQEKQNEIDELMMRLNKPPMLHPKEYPKKKEISEISSKSSKRKGSPKRRRSSPRRRRSPRK